MSRRNDVDEREENDNSQFPYYYVLLIFRKSKYDTKASVIPAKFF